MLVSRCVVTADTVSSWHGVLSFGSDKAALASADLAMATALEDHYHPKNSSRRNSAMSLACLE